MAQSVKFYRLGFNGDGVSMQTYKHYCQEVGAMVFARVKEEAGKWDSEDSTLVPPSYYIWANGIEYKVADADALQYALTKIKEANKVNDELFADIDSSIDRLDTSVNILEDIVDEIHDLYVKSISVKTETDENYITVTPTTATNGKVEVEVDLNIVDLSTASADKTGLADAYDVKQYIAKQIADAHHLKYSVVTALPTGDDIDIYTIYLISKTSTAESDVYQEYMYVDGKWELLGDTTLNLGNYYTKDEADALHLDLSTKIENLSTNVDSAIVNLSDKIDTAIDELSTNIADLSTNVDEIIVDVREEMQASDKALEDLIVKEIADLSTGLNSVIADLSNNIDEQIEEINNNIEAIKEDSLREIEKEIADLSTNVNNKIDDLSTNVNKAIADLSTNVDEALDNLTSDFDEAIADLSTSVDEALENHIQDVTEIKDAIDELEAIDSSIENHIDVIDSSIAALEDKVLNGVVNSISTDSSDTTGYVTITKTDSATGDVELTIDANVQEHYDMDAVGTVNGLATTNYIEERFMWIEVEEELDDDDLANSTPATKGVFVSEQPITVTDIDNIPTTQSGNVDLESSKEITVGA